MSDEDLESIEVKLDLPEGSVVLRAVEVVHFLSPDGQECVAARWQGPGNIVAELGMIDYARQEIVLARFHNDDDEGD